MREIVGAVRLYGISVNGTTDRAPRKYNYTQMYEIPRYFQGIVQGCRQDRYLKKNVVTINFFHRHLFLDLVPSFTSLSTNLNNEFLIMNFKNEFFFTLSLFFKKTSSDHGGRIVDRLHPHSSAEITG